MEQSTSAPQEKVQQVAGQAQEKAQEAAGQAKYRLRDQVDQRSTQAGEQVTQQASDIRSVADQLREQGKDQPAKLAEQAAERAERLGGYLKQSDADRILGDIEDFGRRQPWAVMLGGLAVGFAASRFLKASSSRRYESGYQSYGDGGYDRTYATSPYDTRTYDTGTSYTTGTRYETEVPVVGTYDPDPVQGEPLSDAYDQRRS